MRHTQGATEDTTDLFHQNLVQVRKLLFLFLDGDLVVNDGLVTVVVIVVVVILFTVVLSRDDVFNVQV